MGPGTILLTIVTLPYLAMMGFAIYDVATRKEYEVIKDLIISTNIYKYDE